MELDMSSSIDVVMEWENREAFYESLNEGLLRMKIESRDYDQVVYDCETCGEACEEYELDCKDCVLRERFYEDLVDRIAGLREPLKFYF